MPTGEQFRRLASVFTAEETRLRDAARGIEDVGRHDVFDGVIDSTFLEFTAIEAGRVCRAAADRCADLASTCRDRAFISDAWSDHYRAYERALVMWRTNVERSGVGARPQPPARPAPWVDR